MTITDRIDATTRIPTAYLSPTPPAPRSVKIELTSRCNFRCGFCALRTREKVSHEDIDLPLFKRITMEMRDAGVEEIGVFYIGESFLVPALLTECVRYLKSDIGMPYVFLTSNASAADDAAVDAVMAAGLDSLKWSVNAASPEQFEEIMGRPEKLFYRALQNIAMAHTIREMRGHKTKLYASSILYDDSQKELMRPLLEERVLPFVDEHYWLPLYSMGSLATQREAELGFRPTAGNQGRLGALVDPLPCWAAFTEAHVTSDGKLSACCFDADAKWTMGDLTKQSFLEAWHSLPFRELRAAHLRKDVTGTACEKCVAYA